MHGLYKFHFYIYKYFYYSNKLISNKAHTDLETSYLEKFYKKTLFYFILFNFILFYFIFILFYFILFYFKKTATSLQGYKHTEKAMLKMLNRFIFKHNHPMFGKIHTEKARKCISKPGKLNAMYGKKHR